MVAMLLAIGYVKGCAPVCFLLFFLVHSLICRNKAGRDTGHFRPGLYMDIDDGFLF